MTVKKKTAAWNLYQISFRYLFSDYVAHSQHCSFFFLFVFNCAMHACFCAEFPANIYTICVYAMHLSISPYAIFTELPVKFVSTSRLFFNIISRCCQFLALVCLSPRLHSFIIIISVSKNVFFFYFCFFCMIRIVCICMWFLFPLVPHPFDHLIVWITHTQNATTGGPGGPHCRTGRRISTSIW